MPAGECEMAKNVVAIVGSYREGGMVDQAVDAVLSGAREQGAVTSKIYLIEKHIEYCHNCRTCTLQEGEKRGKCVIDDDVSKILAEVEKADAIVLGSPVNFYNTTALFRAFLERLVGCTYWPWGKMAPKPRSKELPRKAVLISSASMPGFLQPLMTGAPKALRIAANSLGAKPVAKLWIGGAAQVAKPKISESASRQAHKIGAGL